MAFDLYLMGHGCYRQKNGIVVLPENFIVKFYSEHGNGLPESKIQPILRGEEEAKRTFTGHSEIPNYTWQNGEVANWNFYVTGLGPDLRKRQGLSPGIKGPNKHLQIKDRMKQWDVRYVQYFKTLAEKKASDEYTLKMLIQDSPAKEWLAEKSHPITLHVVLCTVEA